MTTLRHLGAAASVALTGVAVVGVMVAHVATAAPPTSGLLLAGFGSLIGLTLVAAGYGLVRLDVSPEHALRVAGWNLLGIVVIGAALGLLFAYQAAVASVPAAPVFSGTVVVAVSAVAHVLIGVNDVRRIRATELARERRKLDVLSRVVRHDLRTLAQLLFSHANRVVPAAEGDDDPEAVADAVHGVGEDLSEIHDHSGLVQALVDDEVTTRSVDLAALVDEVVAEARDANPDADVSVDVPADVSVAAGTYLENALAELVENAVTHHPGTASITVSAVVDGEHVVVAVTDDGPGIPETETSIVTGETDVTQLEHASGLGLWVVRWVADAYDGDLTFDTSDEGSTVRLTLPRA